MGWLKFNDGERSDGESGKIEDTRINVKVNDSGQVTEVLVGRRGESEHDHYWKVDQPSKSGMRQDVDWDKKTNSK